MNILYLTNHLNIGGITSYTMSLALGLKRRGHNIYIASSGNQLPLRFIDKGINFIPIPIKTKKEISPKILFSAGRLSKVIKQCDINIIHANSRTTQVLGYLLSSITNITYISTCHGFFKKRFLRRIFPCWGQKVIAISESVKEHLIRDFSVKEEDIRVIYNGIDLEGFRVQSTENRAQIKKDLGLRDGPVVGIVARLSEVKGHPYLIKAMRRVMEYIPQAQLLIVGEGKTKEELINLSQELKIEKSVFFMPEVPDTKEVLSIMDLFVMPSKEEGLGLALMEAMAFGLAVIGSRVGGIKSLIQHQSTGLLVEPANVDELANAILELLQEPVKRESLGMKARLYITGNFSQEKMVLETERLYLECLNAKF